MTMVISARILTADRPEAAREAIESSQIGHRPPNEPAHRGGVRRPPARSARRIAAADRVVRAVDAGDPPAQALDDVRSDVDRSRVLNYILAAYMASGTRSHASRPATSTHRPTLPTSGCRWVHPGRVMLAPPCGGCMDRVRGSATGRRVTTTATTVPALGGDVGHQAPQSRTERAYSNPIYFDEVGKETTSRPGRSRTSSRPRCGPRSGRCGVDATRQRNGGRHE